MAELNRKGLLEVIESLGRTEKQARQLQFEAMRQQSDAELKLAVANNMLSFLATYREELQAKLAAMPKEEETKT